MNKQNLFIYLLLLLPFFGFSQALTEAEYFIDIDPGFGNGTTVPIPANNGAAELSFQADLTGVSNGVHILYVRVKDANGKWSLTGYRPFYYNQSSSSAAPDLAAVEYFIDEDPGFGNGTAVSVGANSGAIELDFDADLSGVSNGVHILYVRARDANGKWSLTGYRPFYYNAASGQIRDIVAMEYFWDEDPGFGEGIPISFPEPGTVVDADVQLDFSFLEPGDHTYYIRVRDEAGVWSLTATGVFNVPCIIDGEAGVLVDGECLFEDCNGVLGGLALEDDCGVCDEDPENDNATCATIFTGDLSILNLCGGRNYTIRLFEPGTTNLVQEVGGTVSSDGSVSNGLQNFGTYDVFIQVEGYLQKGLANIPLLTPNPVVAAPELMGGDLQGDNLINIEDFIIFTNSFFSETGEADYDIIYDLNCSGGINTADFDILRVNYFEQGDEPPLLGSESE
jgi:hypothetical protein